MLRRQRLCGKQIALQAGVSAASVSMVLRKAAPSRLAHLEPAQPVRRYVREHPGELTHLDIKTVAGFDRIGHRLGGNRRSQCKSRGVRWEYVHVCIDDAARISCTAILPNLKTISAVALLSAAVAYYHSLGITITRAMTDNGACSKAFAFRDACEHRGLRHIASRPSTPRTNGKAERFIKTILTEWAYARAYSSSDQRAAELPKWIYMYNWHRPHGSLNAKPPISFLNLPRDNLLRLQTSFPKKRFTKQWMWQNKPPKMWSRYGKPLRNRVFFTLLLNTD